MVIATVFFVCVFAQVFSAQTTPAAPPTIYAESFRKGPTRIKPESLEVKLDLQIPNIASASRIFTATTAMS